MDLKAKNILIPGIIGSILMLIFFTQLISTPMVVWASSFPQTPTLPGQDIHKESELSPLYPQTIQQWKTVIEQQVRLSDLDADLIAAVVLQESGGDPLAYSTCGAVGLMQVMPRDGLAAGFSCEGTPCFQSRPSIQELFDPRFNIEYGTGMLKNLYSHFGNWRDALHSYGPIDVGFDYADRVLSIRDQYSQN